MNQKREKRIFIIYDGRAATMGVDDAAVMSTCDSLSEAKDEMKDYGDGCVIYSYLDDGSGELKDERWEYTDTDF